MDYYKILNVPETASISDIKSSYRNLAKKYHPDKNTDKEADNTEFWKINEAYNILSNPESKKEYDQKFVNTNIFENTNIRNLFSNRNDLESVLLNDFLFNNIDSIAKLNISDIKQNMGSYFKNNFVKLKQKYNLDKSLLLKIVQSMVFTENDVKIESKNIQYSIKITLEDIFQKKVKKLKITRKRVCPECNGQQNIIKCVKCGNLCKNNFICVNCYGNQFIENRCKCNNGYVLDDKIFQIPLDINILDNAKVIFKEEGDFLKNYESVGDIIIYIKYEKHDDFIIQDKIHLITTVNLSLYEWLYEYNIEILHPSNELIPVSNTGYVSKALIKLENRGLKLNNKVGNLYVILKLDFSNINQDEIFEKYKPLNIIEDNLLTETTEYSEFIENE